MIFINSLIYRLMDLLDDLIIIDVEPTKAVKAQWKIAVNLFDDLLTSKAFDPNTIIYNDNRYPEVIDNSFMGDSALQLLLTNNTFSTIGISLDLKETYFYSLSRIVRLFVKAGYNLNYKNNLGETAYDVIKADEEMTDFLLPALRKKVDRLDSLAANAVPAYLVPYLGNQINYPTVLSKTIKRNLCL